MQLSTDNAIPSASYSLNLLSFVCAESKEQLTCSLVCETVSMSCVYAQTKMMLAVLLVGIRASYQTWKIRGK